MQPQTISKHIVGVNNNGQVRTAHRNETAKKQSEKGSMGRGLKVRPRNSPAQGTSVQRCAKCLGRGSAAITINASDSSSDTSRARRHPSTVKSRRAPRTW